MAMLALIMFLVLVGAYLVATGLSRTTAEVSAERDQRTRDALIAAKQALIAWAADPEATQPGSLPCPDTNDDGYQESTCDQTSQQTGRLPWRTINAPDLRDGSGERLWYAISGNFRKKSGTTIINSDTAGQIAISGPATVSGVIAVVIAPGLPVQDQTRDSGHANDPSSYLEGANAVTDDYAFETRAAPDDRDATTGSLVFNDQMLPITSADLFAVVEPVVATMLERDIKPYVAAYFTQWSAFPFPSRFDNPSPGGNNPGSTRSQSAYAGDTSLNGVSPNPSSGLLPITASTTYPWTASSGTVALTGGIAGSITGVSCVTVALPGWRCSFTLHALDSVATCTPRRYCMVDPSFRVTGGIGANAGTSFANLPDVSEVTVTSSGGAARAMSSETIDGTLSSAGVGTVRYQGTHTYSRYNNSSFTRSMRVTIPDVLVSPMTSSADPYAGWFIANEWYRTTYYAVSPGHLPGGTAACSAPPAAPSCLQVNHMPSYYASPDNNKRAILVLAGRSTNGSARPSSSVANYLEGENATVSDFVFEHRSGTPSSINDRVVVLSP